MNSELILIRQSRLFDAIDRAGLAAVVLIPGPSLLYFTGLNFHLSERPVVAWFKRNQPVGFVLPDFESTKIQNLEYETLVVTYNERPETWPEAFRSLSAKLELDRGNLGGEPRGMRMLEMDFIQQAVPGVEIVSAASLISSNRIQKDQSEIRAMRKAVSIAQEALLNTLREIQIGMTERSVASLLTSEILKAGSDPHIPFAPIVGFGPNSALPHHFASDRILEAGDLILIDWGASAEGYSSDLTRVFLAGDDPGPYQHIVNLVGEANMAAQRAAGPGVPAMEVDRAARGVIQKAGMGEFFTHRTGHGLGLEAHEPPYIRDDNAETLGEGMTFTIEPGVYLRGEYGVRIEDDILITPQGAESLTELPRKITPLSDYR